MLDEIGFTNFFDIFRSKYLNPLAACFYSDYVGDGLDSHRAFTVTYKEGDASKKSSSTAHQKEKTSLANHYDNAEVTLNVALNDGFEGGEIFFKGVRTGANTSGNELEEVYLEHKKGWGIFHRARQLHGALSIEKGDRHNLILWMRSSSVRNRQCPMCWHEPKLIPVSEDGGYGDGFVSK